MRYTIEIVKYPRIYARYVKGLVTIKFDTNSYSQMERILKALKITFTPNQLDLVRYGQQQYIDNKIFINIFRNCVHSNK